MRSQNLCQRFLQDREAFDKVCALPAGFQLRDGRECLGGGISIEVMEQHVLPRVAFGDDGLQRSDDMRRSQRHVAMVSCGCSVRQTSTCLEQIGWAARTGGDAELTAEDTGPVVLP